MKFNELISAISKDEGIPAAKVRKVAEAVVEQIKSSIEQGESFRLQRLVFTTKTVPAREATESRKARPESKRTLVKVRKRKIDEGDRGGSLEMQEQ